MGYLPYQLVQDFFHQLYNNLDPTSHTIETAEASVVEPRLWSKTKNQKFIKTSTLSHLATAAIITMVV